MIGFTRLEKYGRLGNQLFQIAAIYALAKRNNDVAVFPKWKYSPYFKNQLNTGNVQFMLSFKEQQFHYAPLPYMPNTDYCGYFQCEEYFSEYAKEIRSLFAFNPDFIKQTRSKLLNSLSGKKLCAIHVRRGDYVGNSNYYQVTKQYYIAAIAKLIPKGVTCVFFSDDITWCKREFGGSFTYCEDHNEIETMAMISQCDHFIISNSTFSWWGAWLGEKKHSVVVAPHKWNAGNLLKQANDKDIVPKRWIRFDPLAEEFTKHDLTDVTFTIPVRIDHADRLENLRTNIAFLNKYFNTTILVYECDRFARFSAGKGYKYSFIKSGTFHRTALLNKMAAAANTPYIVNWDTDVFMHPQQLIDCITLLRKGKAAGCYPYDGRFLRVERSLLKGFSQCLNVEYFRGLKVTGLKGATSYGGAVAWNKQLFLQGGGENENFIDYGPEDFERYHRFKTLGYVVERVNGPLFHINHNTAMQKHANLTSNNNEYERIKGMTKDELREEVDSWT